MWIWTVTWTYLEFLDAFPHCCHSATDIFLQFFFLTWCGLHGTFSLPEKTITVPLQMLPSFVKYCWGWSVKLSAEVSSLPHVPCLLWITTSTQSELQRLGTENCQETSEPAFPGAKWGHACFPLDGDFKAIASGLHIIPWIYLKSWF